MELENDGSRVFFFFWGGGGGEMDGVNGWVLPFREMNKRKGIRLERIWTLGWFNPDRLGYITEDNLIQ